MSRHTIKLVQVRVRDVLAGDIVLYSKRPDYRTVKEVRPPTRGTARIGVLDIYWVEGSSTSYRDVDLVTIQVEDKQIVPLAAQAVMDGA